MINNVEVCFSNEKDMEKVEIESNEENCTYLAWTDRKKDSSIHSNNKFKERLDKTKNENEKKIIVAYISILIIQETAHLLFRWNNFINTPWAGILEKFAYRATRHLCCAAHRFSCKFLKK